MGGRDLGVHEGLYRNRGGAWGGNHQGHAEEGGGGGGESAEVGWEVTGGGGGGREKGELSRLHAGTVIIIIA